MYYRESKVFDNNAITVITRCTLNNLQSKVQGLVCIKPAITPAAKLENNATTELYLISRSKHFCKWDYTLIFSGISFREKQILRTRCMHKQHDKMRKIRGQCALSQIQLELAKCRSRIAQTNTCVDARLGCRKHAES